MTIRSSMPIAHQRNNTAPSGIVLGYAGKHLMMFFWAFICLLESRAVGAGGKELEVVCTVPWEHSSVVFWLCGTQ